VGQYGYMGAPQAAVGSTDGTLIAGTPPLDCPRLREMCWAVPSVWVGLHDTSWCRGVMGHYAELPTAICW
jgi:hypothetical protein